MHINVTDSQGITSKVALTCRHVVLPEESKFDFQLAFHHGLSSLPIDQLPISQMSVKQLACEKSLTFLNRSKQNLKEPIRRTPLNKHESATLKRFICRIEKHEKRARSLRLSSRPMGHVAYAPPHDVALVTTSTTQEWLVDWAIVALDPTMHVRDLTMLSNEVCLNLLKVDRDIVEERFKAEGLGGVPKGVMSLKGIVPEQEIQARKDDKAFLVAKWGATIGLTYGISNNLVSLVHHQFGEREATVEEWAIIGTCDLDLKSARSRIDFCAPGDSGSVVFDPRSGRIGGQLHAGRVWSDRGNSGHVVGSVDVTYVTPIERLLKDIEGRGFTVSLP